MICGKIIQIHKFWTVICGLPESQAVNYILGVAPPQ